MRVGRLELPRAQCPTDFKSGASTDSAILARVMRLRRIELRSHRYKQWALTNRRQSHKKPI